MYQEARAYDALIGFLDPCTNFQTYLRLKPKAVEKYLTDVMYHSQKMSHILGAYNFECFQRLPIWSRSGTITAS